MLVGSFPSLSQTGVRAQATSDWSEPPQAGHCRAERLLTPRPSKFSHYQVMSSLGGQTRSLLSNESAPCRVTCLRSVPRKPLCGQCLGVFSPHGRKPWTAMTCRPPFSSTQIGNRFPKSKIWKFVILCEHKRPPPPVLPSPHLAA